MASGHSLSRECLAPMIPGGDATGIAQPVARVVLKQLSFIYTGRRAWNDTSEYFVLMHTVIKSKLVLKQKSQFQDVGHITCV